MSDETRNSTTPVHTPPASDAAQILAAVKELLPPAAAEELAAWSRGDRTATATVERLQELSRGDTPPAPEWNPGPSVEELGQEITELEAQSPPPDLDGYLNDCRWLQQQWVTHGALHRYAGTHIAILNGEVVGTGQNSLQLQLDVARKFGVHPQRVLIDYVFGPVRI